jgi:hypothetical protein
MSQALNAPAATCYDLSDPEGSDLRPRDLVLAIPGHDVALSREQAGLRIGCDIDQISILVDEGRIARFWRRGRRIMVWLSDVDAYIQTITEKRSALRSLLPDKHPRQEPEFTIVTPIAPVRHLAPRDASPLAYPKIKPYKTPRTSKRKGQLE